MPGDVLSAKHSNDVRSNVQNEDTLFNKELIAIEYGKNGEIQRNDASKFSSKITTR